MLSKWGMRGRVGTVIDVELGITDGLVGIASSRTGCLHQGAVRWPRSSAPLPPCSAAPNRHPGCSSTGNHADVLLLLQPLDLQADAHHPMVSLGAAPGFENHRAAGSAQTRHVAEALLGLALALLGVGSEEGLFAAVPDDKASGRVFVDGCPVVFEIDSGKRMMAGMITVEGLVVV